MAEAGIRPDAVAAAHAPDQSLADLVMPGTHDIEVIRLAGAVS
ncbi:MAG: hypothetical protein ACRDX8_11510 [Acidimicrobiales bacterium]